MQLFNSKSEVSGVGEQTPKAKLVMIACGYVLEFYQDEFLNLDNSKSL